MNNLGESRGAGRIRGVGVRSGRKTISILSNEARRGRKKNRGL